MSATDLPSGSGAESQRVAAAHARARARMARQRGTIRPLGWGVIVLVCVGAFSGDPGPGTHGKSLWVTVALCVFVATVVASMRERFTRLGIAGQAALTGMIGAAGVALAALQPQGAAEVAGAAAVWVAVARLPPVPGIALGGAITLALASATALGGNSAASVLATALLCALLGLMAHFMRQARDSEEQTEVLLARLEDAREQQTRAAAIAERGRIASELHDVLAHSLSGAAIQLQGARMLAERQQAEPQLSAAIDRASELVKHGLADARQAVGALRGEQLPGVAQLQSLIDSFRDDMHVDAKLRIEGAPRALPADAGLALYRGAQEALTNVARYAPGASTVVELRYERDRTRLRVEDRVPVGRAHAGPEGAARALPGVGGGRGLAGMRERVEGAGGSMAAGPTPDGWRIELVLPG